jgi:hypothetical protein
MNELFTLASGYGQGRMVKQQQKREERWHKEEMDLRREAQATAAKAQRAQIAQGNRGLDIEAFNVWWSQKTNRDVMLEDSRRWGLDFGQRQAEFGWKQQVDASTINATWQQLNNAWWQMSQGMQIDWARIGLEGRRDFWNWLNSQYDNLGKFMDAQIVSLDYWQKRASGPYVLEAARNAAILSNMKVQYEAARVPLYAQSAQAELDLLKGQAHAAQTGGDLNEAQRKEILDMLGPKIAYQEGMVSRLSSPDPVTAAEALREARAMSTLRSPDFQGQLAGLGSREDLVTARDKAKKERAVLEKSVWEGLRKAGISGVDISTDPDTGNLMYVTPDAGKLDSEKFKAWLTMHGGGRDFSAQEIIPDLDLYADAFSAYSQANERLYQYDQRARALGIAPADSTVGSMPPGMSSPGGVSRLGEQKVPSAAASASTSAPQSRDAAPASGLSADVWKRFVGSTVDTGTKQIRLEKAFQYRDPVSGNVNWWWGGRDMLTGQTERISFDDLMGAWNSGAWRVTKPRQGTAPMPPTLGGP